MSYLVTYDRPDGTDTWVRQSFEEANISIGNTMLEFLDNYDKDERTELLRLLLEADFVKAKELWAEHTGESFFIDELSDDVITESAEDFMRRVQETLERYEKEDGQEEA